MVPTHRNTLAHSVEHLDILKIIILFQLYILDDVDAPVSGTKKSSRELAGTLRNLKKVEQALQTIDAAFQGEKREENN